MSSILKNIVNRFRKKSNNKACRITLNNAEKKILYQRITSLRKQTERDVKLSYKQVYDLMKKMSILPETWTEHSTIHKFVERYESEVIEKDGEDDFIKIIKSYLDKIKISDEMMIKQFWSVSTDEQKKIFLNEIAEYCMRNLGIPQMEICNYICKKFNELGYLNPHTIRENMPREFKDIFHSRIRKDKRKA